MNPKPLQISRYSPRRETGRHHFHKLLVQFLNEN